MLRLHHEYKVRRSRIGLINILCHPAELIALLRKNSPEILRPSGSVQLQRTCGIDNPVIDSGFGKFLPKNVLRPCAAVHIAATYE